MQKCHHSVENCCENRDNVWNLCEYIPGHKRNNQDAPFEMAIDGAYICDTAVSSTMTTETVSCFPHTTCTLRLMRVLLTNDFAGALVVEQKVWSQAPVTGSGKCRLVSWPVSWPVPCTPGSILFYCCL